MVIVESPAKARTIGKYLGKDYFVRASAGHVRDLPARILGVDIKDGFRPTYRVIPDKEKIVQSLRKEARAAGSIYLAADPDREGEAICYHLAEVLDGGLQRPILRVQFNEITKPAILEAFNHPTAIDSNKVEAQQARRILDRIVGYKVSPLLWQKVRKGLSAGRVQTVAARLIVDREREIRAFEPEEYWDFRARLAGEKPPPFEAKAFRYQGKKFKISNQEESDHLLDELREADFVVARIERKERKRRPVPPFITSKLQQEAVRRLGFSVKKTMTVAQRLYEGIELGDEGSVGLITYMRTDSTRVSDAALEEVRGYILNRFGSDYLPGKPVRYASKKGAQDAHEAIRPTEVGREPESLKGLLGRDELRLYTLIWNRFVACQMEPALFDQTEILIEAGTAEFKAVGSILRFDGFLKVYRSETEEETGEGEEGLLLPDVEAGEKLNVEEILREQKFTQPPSRFSEASLVKVLEENGVGRPSTYAQILSTLDQRGYVGKEKRMLIPTELGRRVNEFLVTHLDALFNVHFTAEMEKKLDEVEEGKQDWVAMLGEFYGLFEQWLSEARGPKGDEGEALRLMDYLKEVKEWVPASRRGGRVFDDKKFMASMEKQLQQEDSKLTKRQVDTLKRLVVKYIEQLPTAAEQAEELGLRPLLDEEAQREPPAEESIRKLALLEGITFDEPRKVGKRTYDDGEFSASLRGQVQEGRRLTENQTRYLDRLLVKYRDQIPDFDRVSEDLGLQEENGGEKDVQSGPLLELMRQVKTWKEPVKRGRRTWDDKAFFDSLDRQFKERQSLSPKQQQSLKRMVGKYADQIPDFDQRKEELGLVRKGDSAK